MSTKKTVLMLAGTLFVAVLFSLLSAISRPAEALPSHMIQLTYYSNSSFTTEVGTQMILRCNGSQGPVWGNVGPYVVETQYPCNEGAVIGPTCHLYVFNCTNANDPSTCYLVAPPSSYQCPPHIS